MIKVVLGGIGVMIAGVAIAGASWWFLVRQDADLATDPPDIPDELVQLSPSPPTGADEGGDAGDVLTFRINTELSEAAYFVNEELAQVGAPSTAKGSTNAIEGEFQLGVDELSLRLGSPRNSQLTCKA